jgi:hypothetical protein
MAVVAMVLGMRIGRCTRQRDAVDAADAPDGHALQVCGTGREQRHRRFEDQCAGKGPKQALE